jgi:hypothetical protein
MASLGRAENERRAGLSHDLTTVTAPEQFNQVEQFGASERLESREKLGSRLERERERE